MPDPDGRFPTLPPPQFVKPGRALVAWYSYGPPGGRPLVICHGLAASALQFASDAEYFAARGYRVMLPELRGHGRSGAPKNPDVKDFAIEALAADMRAVLGAANVRRADWVGNSLGGIVGLAMMRDRPECFRSFASFGTAYSMAAPRFPARFTPMLYRLFGRRLIAGLTARATTRDRQARRLIRHILMRFDPAILPAALTNLARYDLRDAALGFAGPILIIRGGRDEAVNRVLGPTLTAMRGRSNFTLVDLPEAGHCANLDATGATRAALLNHLKPC